MDRRANGGLAQPATIVDRLGVPTPERARRDEFRTHGIDPVNDRLHRSGSPSAVVYSRRVDDLEKLRECLSPAEMMALTVYCVAKELARGKPSAIVLDGSMPQGDWARERGPGDLVLEAAGLVRFVEARLDTDMRHLLSGYWRVICPQEDLPAIRWQGIARVLCNADSYGQQLGAFKGSARVLAMRVGQLIRQWEASERLNRTVHSRLTRRALERL